MESNNVGDGHSSSSSESSDGEEQEESSSSSNNKSENIEELLVTFREEWKKELRTSPKHPSFNKLKEPLPEDGDSLDSYEKRARILFQHGSELERAGKLYEAIQFYRKAVQIVPDIEFKVDIHAAKSNRRDRKKSQTEERVEPERDSSSSNNNSDTESIEDGELLARIQRKYSKTATLCTPKFEQSTSHVSVLPVEIVLLILRWLVSCDLDLRSLELFSAVCRGFYLCARDPEIWRVACTRVWGLSCGVTPGIYTCWREMFIERARIHYHGCYISKTTYIRHGESSFQDQFYRPWHFVAYYRYFRFFPEGIVLLLTSSDEPAQCVGQLRYRNPRPPAMTGFYRLKDDKITIVVHRQESAKSKLPFKKNKRRDNLHEGAEQTFHMELQIKNHHKKRHVQLVWTHYSVYTRHNRQNDGTTCNFDLVTNRFPPLWFSRVKSYTTESDAPLQ